MTFQSFPWPKFDHFHRNFPNSYLDFCLIAFSSKEFHDFPGFPLFIIMLKGYVCAKSEQRSQLTEHPQVQRYRFIHVYVLQCMYLQITVGRLHVQQ